MAKKKCCIYEHKEGGFRACAEAPGATYPLLYLMGAGARAGGAAA